MHLSRMYIPDHLIGLECFVNVTGQLVVNLFRSTSLLISCPFVLPILKCLAVTGLSVLMAHALSVKGISAFISQNLVHSPSSFRMKVLPANTFNFSWRSVHCCLMGLTFFFPVFHWIHYICFSGWVYYFHLLKDSRSIL